MQKLESRAGSIPLPAVGRAASLRRSAYGPVCLALCGFLAAGCAAKGPTPTASRTATVQAVPSKTKRPFFLSWLGKIPSLVPRKSQPPQAQVPRLIGTVKTVSKEDRFVLIDATTFQAAESGDLLVCIREQKETANLRMSNLQNPPFLIADIASGTPSPGDRVFKP